MVVVGVLLGAEPTIFKSTYLSLKSKCGYHSVSV